ncbi:glycoside hydrolase family 127 protein [Macroventuria anomochaeta]|uniref:Glycoside hydrolase family 127 protein n=1 Tax=Macroventuria anomochaeta TaxID=301207 RepID=A0ACB6S1Y7_9PLEO|nr:glycoside hydrolase family 127 protein [Macroventuria anomochaeta]KAF2628296.1 glycoside hydrolase family 127 protein [Macroventuria anomochaeta]
MSLNGKAFTYVNQLGSSEADKSGREDWFWCACFPPNYSRLFGSLGGYLWHFGQQDKGAYINVHLYTSAKVACAADEGPIELEQSSNWPWDGTVSFTLQNKNQVPIIVRLRIPAWANNFTPRPTIPSEHQVVSS